LDKIAKIGLLTLLVCSHRNPFLSREQRVYFEGAHDRTGFVFCQVIEIQCTPQIASNSQSATTQSDS